MANPVEIALNRVGGIVEASALLRVTNATVYLWRKSGVMPNTSVAARERAKKFADASGVPLLALLGYKDAMPRPAKRGSTAAAAAA